MPAKMMAFKERKEKNEKIEDDMNKFLAKW